MFRPGGGQFSRSSGPFAALNDLRARFMAAAFEVEPKLKRTLRALYDNQLLGNPEWLETSFRGNLAPPSDSAFDLARNLLRGWSEPWGLSDPWCIDWLLEHRLFVWWAKERGQVGVVTRLWSGALPLERVPFSLEVEGWDTTEEIRTDFEAGVRKRFEAELSKYCDERESEAEAAGYVRTRERRNPNHFAWLACYQVCRFSPAAIAKALNVRLYAVQYAVNSLTREIDLTKNLARYRPASKSTILNRIKKATK